MPRTRTTWKKGHPPTSSGGYRPGAGRPPDWLRKKCQEIVERDDLVGFLRDIARGKDFPQSINENGEVVDFPAKVRDRKEAATYLIERGYGRPFQEGDEGIGEAITRLGSSPARDVLSLAGALLRECSKGA